MPLFEVTTTVCQKVTAPSARVALVMLRMQLESANFGVCFGPHDGASEVPEEGE
jgi:hypothetical protein